MSAIATRRRPNAFNWDHQFRKLAKVGQTTEVALSRWGTVSGVSQALQIGHEEAKAAANIHGKMDPAMADIFRTAVKKHGMERGPIFNGLLAHPLLAKDAKLTGQAKPYFRENLKLCQEAGVLLAERVIQDWEAMPKQMRKTNTDANVQFYFKVTTGFMLGCTLFKAAVP